MTKQQFAALAREVYGDFNWAVGVAKLKQVHRATVYRWMADEAEPVPPDLAQALKERAAAKVAHITTLLTA